VLTVGGVAVLDELDSDIHPLLLPELIRMFQDEETNPLDAQLIFSCHNATLFEYLEKEEVYFTEKKADGSTEIYGLKDVKGIRRDTNIYAKYLMGAFGAVPQIG
ncbi:MAG: AAA family ATPase, partial [Rhodospirillales bacterium]